LARRINFIVRSRVHQVSSFGFAALTMPQLLWRTVPFVKRGLLALLAVPVSLGVIAGASGAARPPACLVPKVAADGAPEISPDGRFVLFRRREPGCPLRASVWRSDLAGHHLLRVLRPTVLLGRVSWRRDGLISATLTTRRLTVLLSTVGAVLGRVPITDPFWAPDSTHAGYIQDGQIYLWPGAAIVGGGPNLVSAPTWSPDSTKIGYSRVVGFPRGELIVGKIDGSSASAIFSSSAIGQPQWSPDGRFFALVAGSPQSLYVITPDGAVVNNLTPRFARVGDLPAWSRDGRWIAFTGKRAAGGWGLYIIHTDGTRLRRIARGGIVAPNAGMSWYPHNTAVAFESATARCPRLGLFAAPVLGADRYRLTNRCQP
jgi:Tol biopolymer transport system component